MKTLLLSILAASLLFGCASTDTGSGAQPSRIFGPSVPMGNGTAKSWISLDAQGNPSSLGFTLSKTAFDNLPATLPGTDYMLALPNEATAKTPYQHIMVNWNPQGHEPDKIYTVPHFDFHFYIQPMAEVMAIPPYPQAAAKFDNVPAAKFLHADFAKGPGGVPGMGAHWSDVTSPEFKGQPFTETFIYGSYDGKVTFWEQMVALSYLKTSPTLDKAIKLPASYEKPGYYPTRYSIKTNTDGSQDIALDGFTLR
ncbi:DUF5602 domain-containing protein [Fibrella sp. HMF5335]|uniref:DUF5602 domain-containing protein n=1 Tax=Fibrella rubiginis TaxID=2817060 RepID=A0A939GB27_9BACT|nr:DUF5602 domain-containing protein [Fibrella rubiginis]MBO0935599.1 DUF5602 domain-containing protein [Fibrella rubiginis]